MNDWRLSVSSTDYKAAIKATEAIKPPTIGFINPTESCPNTETCFKTLIKQNNTIIQLLLVNLERIKDLEEQVRQISGKTGPSNSFEQSLSSLQDQLQALNLGGERTKPKAQKGQLFVFKDPKKIFLEEQKRAK